jgi:cation diffusion facilitator CzcD-associated flavoprotein CzcO
MKNGDERQFDVIFLATGFDSVSGSLYQIDIKGTDGVPLADKWPKGISTYLGMTTTNFPNMYFVYGPQGRKSAPEYPSILLTLSGPTGFANGQTIVELQGDWVVDAIDYCNKNDKRTMEPTAQSEADWTKQVAELCAITLFPKTDMGVSIS